MSKIFVWIDERRAFHYFESSSILHNNHDLKAIFDRLFQFGGISVRIVSCQLTDEKCDIARGQGQTAVREQENEQLSDNRKINAQL